jgi:hypothetical protein
MVGLAAPATAAEAAAQPSAQPMPCRPGHVPDATAAGAAPAADSPAAVTAAGPAPVHRRWQLLLAAAAKAASAAAESAESATTHTAYAAECAARRRGLHQRVCHLAGLHHQHV